MPFSSSKPLTLIQNYRLWVIWLIPSVRFLDFQKVKDAERTRAAELFGASLSEPSALASKIMGIKSRTFDVGATAPAAAGRHSADAAGGPGGDKAVRVKLTDKERKQVEKMIREAKSLQEITRLERELNEGRIPHGVGATGDEGMNDVEMKG